MSGRIFPPLGVSTLPDVVLLNWKRPDMAIQDTQEGYGLVSRIVHWGMALGVFALFGLGWWMVGLDYYSPYYQSAPDLHRSVGILLLLLLVFRIFWRLANVKPDGLDLSRWERGASRVVHGAFYVLLIVLMISGYLISTSDGRAIEVFDWFRVPSFVSSKWLADGAGLIHEWTAYAVMILAALHSAGALKHRVLDTGASRYRMWRGPGSYSPD